jgi:hypothetical protein
MLKLPSSRLLIWLFLGWGSLHGLAYQVWIGTHCTPASAAIYPNTWSNTAARVNGWDANPTPCLPAAGNPDQADTSCSVAQYSAVYGAYACQNLASNLYCEVDRLQISSNAVNFYASMTNVIASKFAQAATYGYAFGNIMIYDDVSPYIWSTNEMQQVRDYLDGSGRSNIGLMFDARNNQQNVLQRIALPLINDVVLEAGGLPTRATAPTCCNGWRRIR